MPRDSDGGHRFGWLTTTGRPKVPFGISVSQVVLFIRADPINRGREIKRYFRRQSFCHGVFSMWRARVQFSLQSTYGNWKSDL